jgi:hypothetical protein
VDKAERMQIQVTSLETRTVLSSKGVATRGYLSLNKLKVNITFLVVLAIFPSLSNYM